MSVTAADIDALTREESEAMAAAILRAVAQQSLRDAASHRRNVVTATRVASQLSHLATRLEGFAGSVKEDT